jgi:hypothetical protein
LNRIIKKYDLDMIYVSGPGHGGPAVVGNTYLEGTYSEIYPNISQDEAGLRKLFIQFSFPGGIPSHASPECPGSIHEGGELGYSLSHAFGAVFDLEVEPVAGVTLVTRLQVRGDPHATIEYDLIIVATLERSAQQLISVLLQNCVPREKLFPLRQEPSAARKAAEPTRSGNGQLA